MKYDTLTKEELYLWKMKIMFCNKMYFSNTCGLQFLTYNPQMHFRLSINNFLHDQNIV